MISHGLAIEVSMHINCRWFLECKKFRLDSAKIYIISRYSLSFMYYVITLDPICSSTLANGLK